MKRPFRYLFNTSSKQAGYLSLLLFSFSLCCYAQSDIKTHELLYLETDKDIYEIGEEIWINVTILDPVTHKVSRKSETLHVLLRSSLDHENNFYKIFSITTNPTQAYLALPDSLLSEGSYDLFVTTENAAKSSFNRYAHKPVKLTKQITPPILASVDFSDSTNVSGVLELKTSDDYPVADTRVRLHLFDKDEAKFYKRRITTNSEGQALFSFSNPYKHNLQLTVSSNDTFTPFSKTFDVQYIHAPLSLKLFPEGGYLLHGTQNRLVFSLRDSSHSFPVIDSAYVIDSKNKIICFAEEIHSGIGNFRFLYDENEAYQLIFRGPDLEMNHILIKSENTDPHFSVIRDSVNLTIKAAAIDRKEHNQMQVLITQRGNTYIEKVIPIKNKATIIQIPIKELRNGINLIEIKGLSGKQLHQRLVYTPNPNEITLYVTTDDEYYSAKDTIELSIAITDSASVSKISNLSITVFESLYQDSLVYDNIIDYCLWDAEFESTYEYKASGYSENMLTNILIADDSLVYKWNDSHEEIKTSISDHVDVRIASDQLTQKLFRKKNKIPIVLSGEFGFKMDSIGENRAYRISPELMRKNEGKPIKMFAIDNRELAFEYLSDRTELSGFKVESSLYLRGRSVAVRNWDLLPVVSSDITMLDEISVVSKRDTRDSYLVNLSKLFDLPYEGGFRNWVCHNNILNCSNHWNATKKPIPGEIYFRDGGKPFEQVMFIPAEFEKKRARNIQKIFYKALPNISNINQPSDDSFDLRKTIYWNPSVITNKDGEATIRILASDVRSFFTVRINATDGKGNFGAYETTLKVLDF